MDILLNTSISAFLQVTKNVWSNKDSQSSVFSIFMAKLLNCLKTMYTWSYEWLLHTILVVLRRIYTKSSTNDLRKIARVLWMKSKGSDRMIFGRAFKTNVYCFWIKVFHFLYLYCSWNGLLFWKLRNVTEAPLCSGFLAENKFGLINPKLL